MKRELAVISITDSKGHHLSEISSNGKDKTFADVETCVNVVIKYMCRVENPSLHFKSVIFMNYINSNTVFA